MQRHWFQRVNAWIRPQMVRRSMSTKERPIYMDAQSTTPMDHRVLEAMMPLFQEEYGNPHSRTHAYGWEAERLVEEARSNVAALIGAEPKEIIFTSGATESNNLAIKGTMAFHGAKKPHIVTTLTEHKCVLDSCRVMEQMGYDVTYLPVQKNGIVDVEDVRNALRDDTAICSVMTINNEIGVLQPIEEIGQLCREKGVYFHTDAAQAVGKIPVDVQKANVDLLSISGHKIYGPKGIGALYVRRKPRVRLLPLIHGGGQERGLRSGTLASPLIVGLGKAAELGRLEQAKDHAHAKELFHRLVDGIQSQLSHVYLNGDAEKRWYGCVNLSFAYVEGESLLMALKSIALSSGSACTSASLEPSYVLRALGVDEEMAHTSIRFGLSRFTTKEEVDYTVKQCVFHVKRLREMSPLWEMVQAGVDLKTIQWSQPH